MSIWCYLEGYQVTGEKQYLEKAKYWAKSGLPFVYSWEAPDRPIMKFSTIAVFGISAYWNGRPAGNAWFGAPVQWCGLPYGYWLLKLAEYDQSFPWGAIGGGIMDSGIEQMSVQKDKIPELYADALYLETNKYGGAAWEPELYMKGIFLMRGLGVEVNTRVLQADGKRIHVNTAAILKSAALAGRGHSVSLELEYSAGETSYATIAGLGPITEVRKAGSVVAWTDNLDTAQEGWKTNAEGLLLLKLKHDEQRVKVSVTKK